MKIDSKQVQVILSGTQGGANTDLIVNQELDPFDRGSGFQLRAIQFRINPTDLSDIAADASVQVQVYASSDAVPSAEYGIEDKHIIASWDVALPLTTSGVGVIRCSEVWNVLDGALILGAVNVGMIVASAGATSAINAAVVLLGDAVTLTAEESALSRERFS